MGKGRQNQKSKQITIVTKPSVDVTEAHLRLSFKGQIFGHLLCKIIAPSDHLI